MRLNVREFDIPDYKLRNGDLYYFYDAKRNHKRNQRCWKLYRNTQYRSR